ncbi:hypothetical protein P8605_28105 [Streptomyces sp. T-3]|nr:hypothetical protein [Streptomyces sp. T-3]
MSRTRPVVRERRVPVAVVLLALALCGLLAGLCQTHDHALGAPAAPYASTSAAAPAPAPAGHLDLLHGCANQGQGEHTVREHHVAGQQGERTESGNPGREAVVAAGPRDGYDVCAPVRAGPRGAGRAGHELLIALGVDRN